MSRTEELRPQRGDHIYVDRSRLYLSLYSHHGIYIGSHDGKQNMVIHFTKPRRNKDDNTSPCQYCGCAPRSTGGVVMSCLDCFLKAGQLRIYEYDAGYIRWKPKGTCSSYPSRDDPDAVVTEALKGLRDGFGNYNVMFNNCEDFAHYCKTGKRFSAQSSYRLGCKKWSISRNGYPVVKELYVSLDGMRKNRCMPEKLE